MRQYEHRVDFEEKMEVASETLQTCEAQLNIRFEVSEQTD
jgi:hypothetical protein